MFGHCRDVNCGDEVYVDSEEMMVVDEEIDDVDVGNWEGAAEEEIFDIEMAREVIDGVWPTPRYAVADTMKCMDALMKFTRSETEEKMPTVNIEDSVGDQ